MGYGLPAAVAAALLEPHRTVVNFAGDGDFLMTGQELATAHAYGAQAGCSSIVVDNGSYGTIRMHQEREYPGPRVGHRPGQPRLRGAGAGLRLAGGDRVDSTAAFEPAFGAALASRRPTLLHLKLDTDVITSRTTLIAIRDAAQRSPRARET